MMKSETAEPLVLLKQEKGNAFRFSYEQPACQILQLNLYDNRVGRLLHFGIFSKHKCSSPLKVVYRLMVPSIRRIEENS